MYYVRKGKRVRCLVEYRVDMIKGPTNDQKISGRQNKKSTYLQIVHASVRRSKRCSVQIEKKSGVWLNTAWIQLKVRKYYPRQNDKNNKYSLLSSAIEP